MIGFAETLGAALASFIVPAFVGLGVLSLLARYLSAKYLAAFAIGLYLWFFSDTIAGSSYLAVDSGYTGGFFQIMYWVLFAAGVLGIFALDRGLFSSGEGESGFAFMIPLLVAVGIGIHGAAEGAVIGGTAVTAPNGNLLAAFGGFVPGVAFVLHKALEPMIVGATYWIFAKSRATSGRAVMRDISILAVVFSLPGIIGSSVAYYLVQLYPAADFSYIYALGLGTSIYALARLGRPLYSGRGLQVSDSLKVGAMIIIGFTALYLAALLHS